MIDLSDIKAPGWQRAVSELAAAAPDDRAYLLRLMAVLAQVAGARQAVLFSISGQREDEATPPEARPELVWPAAVGSDHPEPAGAMASMTPGTVDPRVVEHFAEARAAAQAAGTARQTRIFGLDGGDDQFYDGSSAKAFVLALALPAGLAHEAGSLPLRGVVTLFLDQRSKQALQTTLALLEVLSGYIFTHAAQQALRRSRQASSSLDLATRLIASVNTTVGFRACCLQLVNDLCRQLAVDRVSLGWVEGSEQESGRRVVRVQAVSDTENLDRRMLMVQKLEAAMDECLDQEQPVLFPPPPEAPGGTEQDVLLSRAITHAHRELSATDARLRVASFPLRTSDKLGEKVVGVLSVEISVQPEAQPGAGSHAVIDLATVELLQSALDLIAPVLRVRRSDDRNLALRAWDSLLRAGAWAVGPTHTVWKLAGVATLIASLVVTFVRIPYRIGAAFELRPREIRTISVPFDGTIWTLAPGVEHGKNVEEGELLAELDTTIPKLQLVEAQNQRLQYEKEADEAMNKADQSGVKQALAKVEQANARVLQLQRQIEKSRLVSPIRGTIISGDIKDRLRSAVKIGDPLFQVANLTEMIAIAKVEDRDIALVKEGQPGEIAPKSDPSRSIPVVIERIVPLAKPGEGQNIFEVHATILSGGDGLLPGVEGQARFNGEKHSLAWIAGRRILDQLRLWLWW